MFVLGIDPGVTRCGYGVIEALPHGEMRVCSAGVLTTPLSDPLPVRLTTLARDLRALMADFSPSVVVVERVFFQTNLRTAMSVGQASGLALVAASEAGCAIAQYTANEVKLAITGDGSAKKIQMQQMVQRMLHLATLPDPPDVADALGLAICHLGQAGWNYRVAQASMSQAQPVVVGSS